MKSVNLAVCCPLSSLGTADRKAVLIPGMAEQSLELVTGVNIENTL